MKLAIGSRVIIKSKHGSVEGLRDSAVYRIIKKSNQSYAYITRIYKGFYVISETPNGTGDYYDEDDIQLDYKYYRKLKLDKINESINESNMY
jgi:hypothetical protein